MSQPVMLNKLIFPCCSNGMWYLRVCKTYRFVLLHCKKWHRKLKQGLGEAGILWELHRLDIMSEELAFTQCTDEHVETYLPFLFYEAYFLFKNDLLNKCLEDFLKCKLYCSAPSAEPQTRILYPYTPFFKPLTWIFYYSLYLLLSNYNYYFCFSDTSCKLSKVLFTIMTDCSSVQTKLGLL